MELSTINCRMFNGIGFEHPRTGLRVPAELKELKVKPWQRDELEQDPRVFVEGNERDEARAASIAEQLAAPPKDKAKSRNKVTTKKRAKPKTDAAPDPKRRKPKRDY